MNGGGYSRLSAPLIQSVFLYTEKGIVKLQRISGEQVNGVPPAIYLTGAASLPTGSASSFFFVEEEGRIVRAEPARLPVEI